MKYELKKSEKGKRTTVMMTMSQALMRRPEKNSARRSQDETEEGQGMTVQDCRDGFEGGLLGEQQCNR
jgi:hypothetical protein